MDIVSSRSKWERKHEERRMIAGREIVGNKVCKRKDTTSRKHSTCACKNQVTTGRKKRTHAEKEDLMKVGLWFF
jgi:hypothetical protein